MIEFGKRKKNIRRFFIALLFIIFLLLLGEVFKKIDLIKERSEEILLTIQSRIYTKTDEVFSIFSAYGRYAYLMEENRKLKEENMKLLASNEANKLVFKENLRLLELLDMKPTIEQEKMKVCRVVFKNIDELNRNFYIDKGKQDGILEDMVVIHDNSLVGKIIKVYENFAEVSLITNDKIALSAKIKDKNYLGVISGSDDEDGLLTFRLTAPENTVEVGDEIYSSGISDIYPEGIYIGKIIEIDDTFNNIKVEPDFKAEELREVLVYKKFNKITQQKGKI